MRWPATSASPKRVSTAATRRRPAESGRSSGMSVPNRPVATTSSSLWFQPWREYLSWDSAPT